MLLVRQFRDAVGEELLEVPAGVRDVEGEAVADCAAREVLEETGYRVTPSNRSAACSPHPASPTRRSTSSSPTSSRPERHAEDEIELVRMPLADAVDRRPRRPIKDAKSAVAILLAASRVL